jgi:hypothetical protein
MTQRTIRGIQLDHVAHAVPRWQDAWPRYAVELGADWSSGGPGRGFAPGQLRFGNGARIEVLMPHAVELNDFLSRFLDRNGPGPHHLTFKVPDLASALESMRQAGFDPIGVDLSQPEWMEAFIHPKQATGVVVQLAEAPEAWMSPPPPDYPDERRRRRDGSGPVPPASLLRVVHAVAELGAATALFVDLLGGEVVGRGAYADLRSVDVTWGGPISLRLVSPLDPPTPGGMADRVGGPESAAWTDLAEDRGPTGVPAWLGGRSGRVHHLELSAVEPERLNGVERVERVNRPRGGTGSAGPRGGRFAIPPEANLGLGLVVSRE